MVEAKNVLGGKLESCCKFPMTGFYRDGFCRTGPDDLGQHTVCIVATEEFLAYSKTAGNDLTTAYPHIDFPGLIPGDRWCLCALRWLEAYTAGAAPKVILSCVEESTLKVVPLEALKEYAVEEENWTG